jgi:MFS family permease
MLSTYSGLPRTTWVLFAGTVVNRVGYVVTPFLVFYLGSRGIGSDQTPFVLGALGVGNLVGPAVGGLLADRIGRRTTMLIGLAGTATSQGLLYEAPGVATLALAAALLSSTATMVPPAVSALLTDSVEAARRKTVFSLIYWAINIGSAAAGVLGGFLAAHGYWMLFTVDAATSAIYAVVAAVMLPAGDGTRADRGRSGRDRGPDGIGYGVVFRDSVMRLLLPLLGIGLMIYSLTESTLALAIRDHGLPASTYGLMAALNCVLVVVTQPIAMGLLARFPQVPVYVVGTSVTCLGVALTGLAHDTVTFAATVVVWSLGESSVGGIAGSIVANLAPDHARGRYQGSFNWVWGLARFGALAFGSAVYADLGPAVVWWFSAVAGVAAALGIWALAPALSGRTADQAVVKTEIKAPETETAEAAETEAEAPEAEAEAEPVAG